MLFRTVFRIVTIGALACGLSIAQDSASAEAPADAGGRWRGAIEVPGRPLGVIVDLVASAEGWKGTIDIPSQGARNAPLSGVAVVGQAVSFALEGVPGEPLFRGKISDDGKTLSGVFRQGPGEFPFRLARQEGVAAADLGPNQPSRPSLEGTPGEGFGGVWLGDLDAGAVQLRLLVRVAQDAEGRWSGTVDSLDQGATGLKITEIEINGNLLRFALARPPAAYEGLLSPDGASINGLWRQNGAELPLVLHRQAGRTGHRACAGAQGAAAVFGDRGPLFRRRSRAGRDPDGSARRGTIPGRAAAQRLGPAGSRRDRHGASAVSGLGGRFDARRRRRAARRRPGSG